MGYLNDKAVRLGLGPGEAAGHLAMLVFSSTVAVSFVLGALAAQHIAPIALNAVRFWLAALVLAPVVLLKTGGALLTFKAPWRFVLLGGLFVIYFVAMFEGLKTAPPVSIAAVFTLTPVLSAGFGWLLLRQKLTPRMALALALGALGAIWVIFQADISAILAFSVGRGELVFFWGCVAHAFYTPLSRKLNRGEPLLAFTWATLVGAGLVITLFGWQDILATDWANLPIVVWITIFYTAIPASILALFLIQYAALRLPSAKVMAYSYLVPFWVVLWKLAFVALFSVALKNVPLTMLLPGALLVVLALGLLLRER